jgi:hypothetical protein
MTLLHLRDTEMLRDFPRQRAVRRSHQHQARAALRVSPELLQRLRAIRQRRDVQFGQLRQTAADERGSAESPERQPKGDQRTPPQRLDKTLRREARSREQAIEVDGKPACIRRSHGKCQDTRLAARGPAIPPLEYSLERKRLL